MRLQSRTTVTVRGREIGGPAPLICLPLVAGTAPEVLDQAEALSRFSPDLLEWRIDHFENAEDIGESTALLKALRKKIGNTPLIFTCRIDAEGGYKSIPENTRLGLIKAAVESGEADIADIEMCSGPDFIDAVKKACDRCGSRLILSHHNFESTPDEAFIIGKLTRAREMGADIAKVAVTPKSSRDVLVLLNAALKTRMEHLDIPVIAISMGSEGRVTRLAGGLFGSDLTYAIGKASSAPGQIPIDALREAMKVLY